MVYIVTLHIPRWLLWWCVACFHCPDLQRCLLVTAVLWWTGCLRLLPGRSPQAAHRAHQCLGRSHVPLTWGNHITQERWVLLLCWLWVSTDVTFSDDRRPCPSSRFKTSMLMSVRLTSPWLVLFPGSLCGPLPFPWKHQIKGRQVLLSLFWKQSQI